MSTPPRAASILSAMGGRAGWRWWLAPVVWLLSAAAARAVLTLRGADADTTPAVVLVGACVVGLILLWSLGGSAAVAAGHRRVWVYVVMLLVTVGYWLAGLNVMALARLAEVRWAGPTTPRVFVTSIPDSKFYSYEYVDFAFTTLLTLGTPMIVGLMVVVLCAVRWGLAGLGFGLAGAIFVLWLPFQFTVTGPAAVWAFYGLALLVVAGFITAGWWAFSQPRQRRSLPVGPVLARR